MEGSPQPKGAPIALRETDFTRAAGSGKGFALSHNCLSLWFRASLRRPGKACPEGFFYPGDPVASAWPQ